MTTILLALAIFLHIVIVFVICDHYAGPALACLQQQLEQLYRMRQLYEDSAKKSAEAAATVAKIRRRVMGAEDDN